MRLSPTFALLLTLGVARADLAPPSLAPEPTNVSPVAQEKSGAVAVGDVTAEALTIMAAAAESAREDLKVVMDSMKAATEAKRKGRVVGNAATPPNPCASDLATAARLCVQWVRNAMVRMEAATLDLMRAAGYDALGDLRKLGDAMQGAVGEQAAFVKGLPPPARPIPQNPCQGWNVSMWKDCVARVDARLAGNQPDEQSAKEIIRARDRVKQSLDDMIAAKSMDPRRIQTSRALVGKFSEAVANAIMRCEQAQRMLERNLKPAR